MVVRITIVVLIRINIFVIITIAVYNTNQRRVVYLHLVCIISIQMVTPFMDRVFHVQQMLMVVFEQLSLFKTNQGEKHNLKELC